MGTLAEIQERHDAVRELERKLLELQQVLYTYAFWQGMEVVAKISLENLNWWSGEKGQKIHWLQHKEFFPSFISSGRGPDSTLEN